MSLHSSFGLSRPLVDPIKQNFMDSATKYIPSISLNPRSTKLPHRQEAPANRESAHARKAFIPLLAFQRSAVMLRRCCLYTSLVVLFLFLLVRALRSAGVYTVSTRRGHVCRHVASRIAPGPWTGAPRAACICTHLSLSSVLSFLLSCSSKSVEATRLSA